MNEHPVAAFSRGIAAGRSRRSLTRGLVAGLASAVAARAADRTAQSCAPAESRCGGNLACCAAAACVKGRCVCRAGLTACGGTCVHLSHDATNCGKCGRECDPREVCVAGVCRPGPISGVPEPGDDNGTGGDNDGDIDIFDLPPRAG